VELGCPSDELQFSHVLAEHLVARFLGLADRYRGLRAGLTQHFHTLL